MKFSFIIILIVSFISIVTFGFFGIHDTQNHNGYCVFKASQRIDCPKQVSPIDYLTFHLDAFKSFLIIDFSGGFFISFLLFAIFIAGAGFGILKSNLIYPKLSFSYYWRRSELFKSSQKSEFLRWLAFHENSQP